MKTNIDVSLMKNVVYSFFDSKERNRTEDSCSKTKIEIYDFSSVNEIKISKKINEIPYYSQNYEIITQYSLIKAGQMRENTLETQDNILNTQNNDKYLLIEYNNKITIKHLTFDTFILHLPNPKLFIFHILDSNGLVEYWIEPSREIFQLF